MSSESTLVVAPYKRCPLMGQVSNFGKCTLWVMKPFERFPLEIFFYEKSPL